MNSFGDVVNIYKRKNECGAIIVEATLSLTAFVFVILIFLSVIDICYVQAKMGIAINSVAKELSQYAYLYDAFGLDNYMSGENGKSSEFMQSFSEVLKTVSENTEDINSTLSDFTGKAFGAAENTSIASVAKDVFGMEMAKVLMDKNLACYEEQSADAFLKRHHVVDGWAGLDFLQTSFLTDEKQSEIHIVVCYKIQVIRLLNIDFEFNFVQQAKTKAWGDGVSLINE